MRKIHTLKTEAHYHIFSKTSVSCLLCLQLGDQDKSWTPHIACVNRISGFSHWIKGKRKSVSFGIPMVWREPRNHHDDCFFCMVKSLGRNAKSMKHIKYPNIPSAMRPVPHSDDVPVPIRPEYVHRNSSSNSSSSDREDADVEEEFNSTLFKILGCQKNLHNC